MNYSRIEARREMISVIHRALVEVMTLKQANLPLQFDRKAYQPTNEYKHHVAKGARFETDTSGHTYMALEPEKLQQIVLDYIQFRETTVEDKEELKEDQLDVDVGEELLENRTVQAASFEKSSKSAIQPQEADTINTDSANVSGSLPEEEILIETKYDESTYEPADDNWLRVSLADDDIKFAVGLASLQIDKGMLLIFHRCSSA